MAEKKEETKVEEKVETTKVSVDKAQLDEIIQQNKDLQEKLKKAEGRKTNNPLAKYTKERNVNIKMYDGKYVIGISPETGCKTTIKDKKGKEHLIVDLLLMDKDGNESKVEDVSLNDLVNSNKNVKIKVINFYKDVQLEENGKVDRVKYTDWSSKYTGQEVENIVVTEVITTEAELPNGKVVELKSNVINI